MSLNHLVTSTEVIDAIVNNLTVLGTLVAPTVTIGGFTPNMAIVSDGTGTLTSGQIDLKTEVKNVLPIVSGGTNSSTALASGFLMQSLGGKIVESSITPASVPTLPIDLVTGTTGILPVSKGGTNSNTSLTGNQLMFSDTGKIAEAGALTNGQLFIGNTGNAPSRATISVSANMAITNGSGTISLDTIQAIQTVSSPTFNGLTLTSLNIGTDKTGQILVYSYDGTGSVVPSYRNSTMFTNTTIQQVFSSGLISGNTDLFTVPANMRAIVKNFTVFNPNGTSANVYLGVKISGTYYQLTTSQLITQTTSITDSPVTFYVYEAGETIFINNNNAGCNYFGNVLTFPNTLPLKTVKNLALTSGNNVIYTVPNGKTAYGFSNVSSLTHGPTLFYVNTSGGSLTVTMTYTPNASSAIQIFNSPVSNGTRSNSFALGVLGFAGDAYTINTPASTATQIGYITVEEV